MDNTPEKILSCSSRSIFSMAEVRQEKIESKSELQVGERGHQHSIRVQDESRGGTQVSVAEGLTQGPWSHCTESDAEGPIKEAGGPLRGQKIVVECEWLFLYFVLYKNYFWRLIKEILICCTAFTTLGFSRDNFPKIAVTVVICVLLFSLYLFSVEFYLWRLQCMYFDISVEIYK